MRATRFLWIAAGRPTPTETDGAVIPTRNLHVEAARARAKIESDLVGDDRATALDAICPNPRCAACGETATNRLSDAISDNFTTVKNACRAWPFGGRSICQACLWCCKTLALRCSLFFAREDGFWFVPIRPFPNWPETRPDPLAALLHPPEPPFVAGLPLYGIDHGGEANAHRAIWPWAGDAPHPCVQSHAAGPRLFVPKDPLIKLQSKHTALYCEVSRSRERYRLQVDDVGDVTVDVALWRRLRAVCDALLTDMRAAGIGAQDARGALLTGHAPARSPTSLLVGWRDRVEPFRSCMGAPWWKLFVNLLLMPELTEQPQPGIQLPAAPATEASLSVHVPAAPPAAARAQQLSMF